MNKSLGLAAMTRGLSTVANLGFDGPRSLLQRPERTGMLRIVQ